MRKPVSGGARTGDTDVNGGADDERSETDGVSEGDVADGGEPWREARRRSACTVSGKSSIRDGTGIGRVGCWFHILVLCAAQVVGDGGKEVDGVE